MLCTATRGTEQRADIFLDILTYADLLALKSRRKGGADAAAGAKTNNKRYMILTQTGRERVHYPLPLSPDAVLPAARDVPHAAAPEAFPTTSHRPAPAATTTATTTSAGYHHTHHHSPSLGAPSPSLARQYDDLLREKEELSAAYERLQRDSTREIAKVRRRCDDLASQLQEQADQMAALHGELLSHGGDARVVEGLRRKLQSVEDASGREVRTLGAALDKHKKEVLVLNTELSRSRREEERLRRHVRQLEAEYKTVQRRVAASSSARERGGGGGYGSGYGSAPRDGRSISAGGQPLSRAGGHGLTSRAPVASRSTASSRGSSVVSSTAASRANSVGPASRSGSRSGSRAVSRGGSQPPSQSHSRAVSADRSRPTSADRSRPTSSRASSAEHSRPPSRDSRSASGGSSARRGGAPPSLERAAREALHQKTMRARGTSAGLSANGGANERRAPPPARSSGYGKSAGAPTRGGSARAPAPRHALSDGGYSSDEWARGMRNGRPPVSRTSGGRSGSGSTGRGSSRAAHPPLHDEAHKENRLYRSEGEERSHRLTSHKSSSAYAGGPLAIAARAAATLQGRHRGSRYADDDDDDEADGAEEDGEDHLAGGERETRTFDATDDIQDIDRRLNALQQFLTSAKAPR